MAVEPNQWDQSAAGEGRYSAARANGHGIGRSLRNSPRHAANTERNLIAHQTPAPQRAGRERWPLVADDLFLVIGDDIGKLRVNLDVAQIGLAGALLAELVLADYATIDGDCLIATRCGEPIDPLAGAVIRQVRAEHHELPVRKWIAFLAATNLGVDHLYDNVGHRLTRAGRVARIERGFFWRHRTQYRPVDANDAGWAWARISSAVSRGWALPPSDVAFAGLMLATGLHRYVLLGDSNEIEHRLRARLAGAGADIRALIRHTQDAFSSAVMTSH